MLAVSEEVFNVIAICMNKVVFICKEKAPFSVPKTSAFQSFMFLYITY